MAAIKVVAVEMPAEAAVESAGPEVLLAGADYAAVEYRWAAVA